MHDHPPPCDAAAFYPSARCFVAGFNFVRWGGQLFVIIMTKIFKCCVCMIHIGSQGGAMWRERTSRTGGRLQASCWGGETPPSWGCCIILPESRLPRKQPHLRALPLPLPPSLPRSLPPTFPPSPSPPISSLDPSLPRSLIYHRCVWF